MKAFKPLDHLTAIETDQGRFIVNDMEFSAKDFKRYKELRGGKWIIFLNADSRNLDIDDGPFIELKD